MDRERVDFNLTTKGNYVEPYDAVHYNNYRANLTSGVWGMPYSTQIQPEVFALITKGAYEFIDLTMDSEV